MKFDGLEARRCEDITGINAPETGPKSFGTFEKQALGLPQYFVSRVKKYCKDHSLQTSLIFNHSTPKTVMTILEGLITGE